MTSFRCHHTPAAILAVLLLAAVTSVAWVIHLRRGSPPQAPERLFFTLRIESRQTLLTKTNLLGEAGHLLTMRLVSPEAPNQTKISLQLMPQPDATERGYNVSLSLEIPELTDDATDAVLHLWHGEEKRFLMTLGNIPVTVTILLMRVDSPEFEAWKDLVTGEAAREAT